jgi:hypothetical protein
VGEKKTGSLELLFESLDLTPIHPILWSGLHRVEYDPVWDLRALVLRQLLQIPYVKDARGYLPSLRMYFEMKCKKVREILD